MKRFIQHSALARDRRFIRQDNITATVLSTLPDDVDAVVDVFAKLDPLIEKSVRGAKAVIEEELLVGPSEPEEE